MGSYFRVEFLWYIDHNKFFNKFGTFTQMGNQISYKHSLLKFFSLKESTKVINKLPQLLQLPQILWETQINLISLILYLYQTIEKTLCLFYSYSDYFFTLKIKH